MMARQLALFGLLAWLLWAMVPPAGAQEAQAAAAPTRDASGNLITGAPSGRLEMRLQGRASEERIRDQKLVPVEVRRDRREAKIADLKVDEGDGVSTVLEDQAKTVSDQQLLQQSVRRKVTTRLILDFNNFDD